MQKNAKKCKNVQKNVPYPFIGSSTKIRSKEDVDIVIFENGDYSYVEKVHNLSLPVLRG